MTETETREWIEWMTMRKRLRSVEAYLTHKIEDARKVADTLPWLGGDFAEVRRELAALD